MTYSQLFAEIGEPYASGLFSDENRSLFYRHCAGYAYWFDAKEPVPYRPGELLYPCGAAYLATDCAVYPQYAATYGYQSDRLKEKCIRSGLENAEAAHAAMDAFCAESHFPGGWLHGSPNYSRIVREGLASYRERVRKSPGDRDFRDGLLLLLDAMERYLGRCIAYLKEAGAPAALTDAMERVPFQPAQTYYEGLVAWNLIFYFDGCDNLGCLDAGLGHLYRGENLVDVIAQLFDNIDSVGMWSCTIGPDYNAVTEQALLAVRGKRRPMLELRVTHGMPERLWEMASEMLCAGGTNPSFYNDRGIHDMISAYLPKIPEEDLARFCGCGCTETNLEGL
ncbi:MAG: hypothetical protein ACI3XM_11785, partial [Eubacteriales bacterium]